MYKIEFLAERSQNNQSFQKGRDCKLELPPLPDDNAGRAIEVFRRALPELVKLDRYEKRALSRRKFATRALCAYTR